MTKRIMLALAVGLTCVAACGKRPSDASSPTSSPTPPAASSPAAGFTDQAECAGVYAAMGGIDPGSVQQDTASPAFTRYARMLSASINATTSATASDAGAVVVERAHHWKSRPAADQAARAAACQSKYGF